jgi:surface-anchored protein
LTVTGGGAVDADGKIALSVRAICLNQNNVAILKPGTYTATVTITITASDGTQASATVPVSFVVMQ